MARSVRTLTARRVGVSGVYEIRHRPSERCYIGSSVNIDLRWREHQLHLGRGVHKSRYLQRVWSKYGAGEFAFRILLRCKPADLVFYEQRCLDSLRPVFNSAPDANSQLGYRHSPEAIAKMKASAIGRPSSFKGFRHSKESRQRISENRKGISAGPYNEERRRKIGEAHRGRIITSEHRMKIAATLTRRKNGPPSEATRAKISAANMGRQRSIETRAKIGAAQRGRQVSADTRAKLSAAARRWWESR